MDTVNMLNKPRTKVGFRIFAPSLDPSKVSQVLGLTPDHTHLVGDYPRDNPRYNPYKHGMWALHSKLLSEEPFTMHLENLLSILEPKQKQILELSEKNSVDFSCSLFSQSGFQLPPNLLRRIANLGATLGVDVYPSNEASKDDNLLTDLD
ncbi:MAG: DUF4279 domain-containing protein [Anaerolineae bacterium]|nr:DUF4279 domain-containing protein [Anaerolineae bacterium]